MDYIYHDGNHSHIQDGTGNLYDGNADVNIDKQSGSDGKIMLLTGAGSITIL